MWQSQPQKVSLAPHTVDIWRVQLLQPAERLAEARTLLSSDELERAERFRFHTHRVRYIFARAALRSLLGKYLETLPSDLVFTYTSFGKPFLPRASELTFNVSHSEDLALVAIGGPKRLGVDLERIRSDRELPKLARRYFSTDEAEAVLSLEGDELVQAFYRCWSRKESFIKAVGEGLSHSLDRFAVTLRAGEPARFIHIDGDPAEASRWSLFEVDPGAGFAGAVCFDRTNFGIARYDFSF
jgi:4'-phosphopantetheinyl transferase